jgi:DNA-binding GntR family transcriptional regulator
MTDKPLSTSQRALRELRDKIFSGELAAGSDHLESELADLLEMSRTPVREAVLTLESQGLLELRPRKGVRILPLSPEDMS